MATAKPPRPRGMVQEPLYLWREWGGSISHAVRATRQLQRDFILSLTSTSLVDENEAELEAAFNRIADAAPSPAQTNSCEQHDKLLRIRAAVLRGDIASGRRALAVYFSEYGVSLTGITWLILSWVPNTVRTRLLGCWRKFRDPFARYRLDAGSLQQAVDATGPAGSIKGLLG